MFESGKYVHQGSCIYVHYCHSLIQYFVQGDREIQTKYRNRRCCTVSRKNYKLKVHYTRYKVLSFDRHTHAFKYESVFSTTDPFVKKISTLENLCSLNQLRESSSLKFRFRRFSKQACTFKVPYFI